MIGDVHVPRNLTSIGGGGAMRTGVLAPLFRFSTERQPGPYQLCATRLSA